MSNLQEILRRLPQLTRVELETLQLRLKAALSLTAASGSAAPDSPVEDWLLEGLYFELRRRGLLILNSRLPPAKLREIAPNFAAESAHVRKQIEGPLKRFRGPLSPREGLSLGALAARALAEYISPPTPLSPRTMLLNVSKVPEAIDHSYPDYLQSGLFNHLLTAMPSLEEGHGR